MDEVTGPRLESYLDDLRALRQKIIRQFHEAAAWNQAHPDERPITDDEVDPGGVLRAMDRDVWQLIGDWEVAQAMARYHRRLKGVQAMPTPEGQ